jgi:putative membrane protein
MGLGFVVARFGLFLTVIAASHTASGGTPHTHWESSVLGIALLLTGVATIFASLHNHRQFIRTLPPDDVPHQPIPWLTTALSAATAIVGMLMAVYLAVT